MLPRIVYFILPRSIVLLWNKVWKGQGQKALKPVKITVA